MTKKIVLSCLAMLLGATSLLAEAVLELAQGGKSAYTIIYDREEKEAATELKTHLDLVTGCRFAMIEESKARSYKGPGLYVGHTAKAKALVRGMKLADQEHYVKSVGKDIIFTGGLTRGTLYGVYEFLEKYLGCEWFARDTSVIPRKKVLHLKKFTLRGKPSFESRNIVDDTYGIDRWINKKRYAEKTQFKKRMRGSLSFGLFYMTWPEVSRQYPECHNYYNFIDPRKYFKTHPEYFSMDKNGKRFHGTLGSTMQGGAFCMTNPAVTEIVYNKLVEYIEADRKKLPKKNWPTVYDFSQMDSCPMICFCPECKKILKKEGSESGLQMHFLNPIARRIAKKYPGIKIRTFAYACTKKVPNTLRPEKNLIIRWCNLFGYNDCYRPITHPLNKGQKKELDEWHKAGANLAVWAYWNMAGMFFNPPRVETMIDAIAPDLRYYHKSGVTSVFIEGHRDLNNPQNFYRLQNYVGQKLLANVDLDPEKLIRRFMKVYYGPAEKPMTAFLTMLRKAVKEEKVRMRACTENTRPYCTEAFMNKVWKHLTDAYNATKKGSLYRSHVEEEMITPLYVINSNTAWKSFDRQRKALLKQYNTLRKALIEDVTSRNKKSRLTKTLEARLEADNKNFVHVDLPVPEQFKDKEVIMIGYPKLSWAHSTTKDAIVDDPDSSTGKALVTNPYKYAKYGKKDPRHDLYQTRTRNFSPLDFGAYDYTNRRSLHWHFGKKIPQDEKYHLYHIGSYRLGPGSFVWGFYWNTRCDLSSYYKPDDGMEHINVWEIYVSAKFTGPAYVKGSKKKNEIYWDKVILVREKNK